MGPFIRFKYTQSTLQKIIKIEIINCLLYNINKNILLGFFHV